MNRRANDGRPAGPPALQAFQLLAPKVEQAAAQRLLLGLDQAQMAARLGLEREPVVFGRFVIERMVGRGGMGVVFAARDLVLGRTLALKLLTTDSECSNGLALAEARVLARLVHPNIVKVYAAGIEHAVAYIAMEFIHGQSLREWLRSGTRSLAEIITVFVAAGRGLAAAHQAGLLHRDFKPDNVLVGADGRVCVVDFGLARDLGRAGEHGLAHGLLAGTPAYMAPERLRGEPATPSTDQFGFCVCLWEACCGVRPFAVEQLERLAAGEWVAPARGDALADRSRSRPGEFELLELLEHGLAADPTLRWPDMPYLLDVLEGLVAPGQRGSGIEAHAAASASTPRPPLVEQHNTYLRHARSQRSRQVLLSFDGAPRLSGDQLAPDLGRYQIIRVLDLRPNAAVFVAHDPILDRRVTLELLTVDDPEQRLALACKLASVTVPGLAAIYETGQLDGSLCLVTERVEGPRLSEWAPSKRWPERLSAYIAAGEGLAAAHAAGVVELGFSAEGVTVEASGRVCITEYAGCEHELGASDQQRFCASLWAALGKHSPEIPANVTAALRRGLDPDPARRFASMTELLAVLALELPPCRTTRAKPSVPEPSEHRLLP